MNQLGSRPAPPEPRIAGRFSVTGSNRRMPRAGDGHGDESFALGGVTRPRPAGRPLSRPPGRGDRRRRGAVAGLAGHHRRAHPECRAGDVDRHDIAGPTWQQADVTATADGLLVSGEDGQYEALLLNERTFLADLDGPALVPEGNQMRQRPAVVLVHGGPGSTTTPTSPLPKRSPLSCPKASPSSRSSTEQVTSHGRTPQTVTGRSSPNSSPGRPGHELAET